MPEISRFYGIAIFMNYNDHLPPHFHAKYQGYEVTVSIEEEEVTGKMPKRTLNLVFDWLDKNRDELLENWELARSHKKLNTLKPLL